MTFYDKSGEPIAYAEDDRSIYLFSGKPVAYLYDDSVWSYDGGHLGWFADGLVRDSSGNTVYFTEHANGGPLRPLKALRPMKGLKELKPMKSLRELKPLRPLFTPEWSVLSGEEFFLAKE